MLPRHPLPLGRADVKEIRHAARPHATIDFPLKTHSPEPHHDPPTSLCRPAAADVPAFLRPAGLGLWAGNRRGHGPRCSTWNASIRPTSRASAGHSICRPRRPISIGSSSWARTGGLRLEKFDFAPLDPREKAEYLLLRSEVQGLLDETARAKTRLAEIAPLLPFRTIIHELETARRQWGALDCQAAASKVADLADAVKQVREHLPKPGSKPVSAAVALRTAGAVHELQELLKRWYAFYDGYQPDFAWWVKKPYDDAAKQLEEYAKYLREEVAQVKGKDEDPLVGQPIGPRPWPPAFAGSGCPTRPMS